MDQRHALPQHDTDRDFTNWTCYFQSTSLVEVAGAAVCGVLHPADITSGTLEVAGRTLGKEEAAPILARIATTMQGIIRKKICARYEPSTRGLVEKANIDGVYQANADKPIAWINANDGYHVAP